MRAVLFAIIVLTSVAANADDWQPQPIWHDTDVVESGHNWQVTFGLGYRTDETGSIHHGPTMELGFLRFLTSGLALGLRGTYVPEARTDFTYAQNQDIDIIGGVLALRLQDPRARWSPFGEIGIDVKRYSGNLGYGQTARETKAGWMLGLGITWRATPAFAVDLVARHVVNHSRVNDVVYAPLTPPIGPDGTVPVNLSQAFFNPTMVNFQLRVGI